LFAASTFNGNNPFYLCLICFAVGAIFWLWRDKLPFSNRAALGCFVLLAIATQLGAWLLILLPVCGGYCLLWFAYGPTINFAKFADKTDLSYGTYLYGCPVQQLLAMSVAWRQPFLNFILAVPISLCIAGISWYFVEKPFLDLKKRLRKPE